MFASPIEASKHGSKKLGLRVYVGATGSLLKVNPRKKTQLMKQKQRVRPYEDRWRATAG